MLLIAAPVICLIHMVAFCRMVAGATGRLSLLLFVLVLSSSSAQQAAPVEAREEVHKSVPFSDIDAVLMRNIKGNIRIEGWEKNEVKIDAIKHAGSKQGLKEADVVVEKNGNRLCVYTRYANAGASWSKVLEWFGHSTCGEGQHVPRVDITVDYMLFVPRTAVLGTVSAVTGDVEIRGIAAGVDASSVNGKVTVQDASGPLLLRSFNGPIEASLAKVAGASSITSMNASVTLSIPADSNARVVARSVNGNIDNDFGLPVEKGQGRGQALIAKLGNGGPELRLRTINAPIKLRRIPPQTQAPVMRKDAADRKRH